MKTQISLLLVSLGLVLSCQQYNSTAQLESEIGTIKVAIMYPNDVDKTFDMNYYTNKHMPMLSELFGANMKQYKIDSGISGRTSADKAPFLAIGYLYFENLSDYQKVFRLHSEKILNDIPNYTNAKPIVQISEIVI